MTHNSTSLLSTQATRRKQHRDYLISETLPSASGASKWGIKLFALASQIWKNSSSHGKVEAFCHPLPHHTIFDKLCALPPRGMHNDRHYFPPLSLLKGTMVTCQVFSTNSLSPRVSFFITSPSTLLLPVAMQFPPQINSHQTSFQWLHIQASRGLRVEQEEKKHTLLPNHILSTPFILELGCSIYTYCLKISRNTKINILVYQCSALLKSFPNVSKATRWKVFGFLSHKP